MTATWKTIEYAYPTSPQADKLNRPNGCYIVEVWTGTRCITQLVYDTLTAAVKKADPLPVPYHRYSLRPHRTEGQS